MIEVLGQAPISSVTTAGRSEFMSIFRNRASNSFGEEPNRYPRPYTSTRGILINKEFVVGVGTPNLKRGYQFQFNPQTITDVKSTLYETRQYAGLPYNDYIWGGGGERLISFQLFLDNTPQSKQRHFRPTAYGSKLAKEFKRAQVTPLMRIRANILLMEVILVKDLQMTSKVRFGLSKKVLNRLRGHLLLSMWIMMRIPLHEWMSGVFFQKWSCFNLSCIRHLLQMRQLHYLRKAVSLMYINLDPRLLLFLLSVHYIWRELSRVLL